MTTDDRHHKMDAGRIRAELSVQDLWLRYLGLGGSSDAFDLDGYLQGLVPLDSFEENVLAQAVNEALIDSYDGYSVPLVTPVTDEVAHARLLAAVRQLLDEPPLAS